MNTPKREKLIFLAMFMLLLSSCAGLDTNSDVESGYIRGGFIEMGSKETAGAEASAGVLRQPDLTGEWYRTDCRKECEATIVISEQTEEGFLVDADCRFYGKTGNWNEVSVLFDGQGKAGTTDYRGGTGTGGDSPAVRFTLLSNGEMYVHTLAGYDDLGFGAFVTIAGYYTRGEPKYNPGSVEEYLTEKEQETLQEMLGEEAYLWHIARPMNIEQVTRGAGDGRYLDGSNIKIKHLKLQYPNLDAEIELILSEDGRAYCSYLGRFYTNDPAAAEMPALWPKVDENHSYFRINVGGKFGELLITIEEGEETTTVSVWDLDDVTKPIQIISVEASWVMLSQIIDVNFDEMADFVLDTGSGDQFWLWDESQGQFVREKSLEKIPGVVFDEQHKTFSESEYDVIRISTYRKDIYRWINGEVVCVRKIEMMEDGEHDKYTLLVEDRQGNRFVKVFYQEFPFEEDDPWDGSTAWKEMYERWCDPDYHGE